MPGDFFSFPIMTIEHGASAITYVPMKMYFIVFGYVRMQPTLGLDYSPSSTHHSKAT